MDREPPYEEVYWISGPPAGPVAPLPAPVRPQRGRGLANRVLSLALAFVLGCGVTAAVMSREDTGSGGTGAGAVAGLASAQGAPASSGANADASGATTAAQAASSTAAKAVSAASAAKAAAVEKALEDMIASVQPTVVTVSADFRDTFGGGTITSTGSGVIITPNGFLLTNAHVVDGADQVVVTLMNGQELAAQVIAIHASRDLALLKVKAARLKAARPDDGDVRVGQTAIAIGNPLGRFPGTVTRGVISGLDRSVDVSPHGWQSIHLDGLIQTDAAINEGSSGGALFDTDGRLIGITNSSNPEAQGVAFAIPIAAASGLIDKAQQSP